jgi:hypothetical protein
MVEPIVGADDQWTLTPDDQALVMNKHRANRLGFAILLTFFSGPRPVSTARIRSRAAGDRGAEPTTQRAAAGGR